MKTASFESVADARMAAEKQLSFSNKMIQRSEAGQNSVADADAGQKNKLWEGFPAKVASNKRTTAEVVFC